jgi:hypothetical protein
MNGRYGEAVKLGDAIDAEFKRKYAFLTRVRGREYHSALQDFTKSEDR